MTTADASPAYRCPVPACARARITEHPEGLACPNGHFYPFVPGTRIPVFQRQQRANEYSRSDAAQRHDNALRWVLATFRTDEGSLRESLVERLQLRKGDRVLITGAGAGNDLPYLARRLMGSGEIHAQDIAQEMLLAAVERFGSDKRLSGVKLHFSVSDAANLPYEDGHFDAAYHFGGINLFPDIRAGIAEMNRVVRESGRVVIGDEGLAPWLKNREIGRMLVRNNPLYASEAPLAHLPETARSPKMSWELCNTFYVIEFTVSMAPLPIDIDVPHVGVRGGTIRSRYYGQLEGIDPALRDQIHAEAERRGISRVEYLEFLLRSALAESGRRGGGS